MFTKLHDFLRTFAFHFLLARRSTLKGSSRWQVFATLSRLYMKALRYPAKNTVINCTILNYKVSAYGYGDLLYLFKEIFLRNDYHFESNHPKPAIIDCGANIGMSILYFKMLYPQCAILAFEPNPFAFEILKRNIKQNNLSNVQFENRALSDREGSVDFFIGKNKGSLVGSIVDQRAGDEVIKVPASRLTDYIGNRTFDFIKIDIEGAEHQVVRDLVDQNKLVAAEKYTIEYHHNILPSKSRLASFLHPFERHGFGYTISGVLEGNEDAQNLLIKVFRERPLL
jgi:FkbM family methyltransferase